ncbi:MAG: dicarboxylate/amino acid:cation symporter [Firmicutes bacterium]|nr:dicarboxylate/amino acid:cation symporter [Bacillota bacterium]
MKKVWKNYKSSIFLIISIIIGTIIGIIFKEKTNKIKALGDLFINMLTCIVIPIVFLNITISIGKMNKPKRIGKVLITTFIVFLATSIISALLGIIASNITPLITGTKIISETTTPEKINFLDKFANTLTVSNLNELLSVNNMIALILASIIFGIALNKTKETKTLELLESLNNIVQKIVNIIMLYAPIGIGAYFAVLVGNFGGNITSGYIKTFIIYLIVSIFIYFIIYGFYAYIAGGKEGIKRYFKYIITPTITALSTCSSAASIPSNTEAAQNIGVPSDIASAVIPLGTNFHKDGSIVGNAFKIMFLVYLFNLDITFTKVLLVTLLSTLLITALPIGGGTIAEMFIISILGAPISALPMLTIIATIIDAPATVLNVVGDSASSMLVTYLLEGKNWLNKRILN